MNLDARMLRHLDKLLILVMGCLIALGLVMVSSAAQGFAGTEQARTFVVKQIVAIAIGLAVMVVLVLVDYDELKRLAWPIYGINIFLLTAVLVVGKVSNGAQSWLGFGPVQIQPSELGKVMLILTLGHQLSEMDRLQSIWDLIPVALHVLPPFILLLLQPDLGTALVFVAITVAMVYMAGFPGPKLTALVGTPIAAVGLWLWAHMKYGVSMWPLQEHQVKRLEVFIDPTSDPLDTGYQVLQSKISIGSGGLWGQGLFHGTQNQLGFLPYQHTDFIFSVIGEELGFVGGAAVLVLFLLMLVRIMTIAGSARDMYGCLIATGVAAMIGFHVVENIGMTLGLLPVAGIPLPFISYGGSAMLTDSAAIGLVLNVGMRRQKINF